MTRDEAIYQALALEHPPGSVVPCLSVEQGTELQRLARKHAEIFVDRQVALGLLTLDEPKAVEQQAIKLLGHYGGHIVDALRAAGFKIVKA